MTVCSYINTLVACAVFLPFPLLLLLLQLFDALLQHIWPKVTLKVRQLLGTCQTIFCRLLEDILLEHIENEISILIR